MANNNQFIKKLESPSDSAEATYFSAHDVAYYGTGVTLTKQRLFTNDSKPGQYKTHDFNIVAQTKEIHITHMKLNHNFQFTPRANGAGFEADAETLRYFLNFSYLTFSRFDKSYDPIPLSLIMPFDIVNIDTTISIQARQNPIIKLPEEIQIPVGGMEIFFVPADGLTTAAAAATNPQLTGLATEGFYLDIVFTGYQNRPMA